MLANEFVKKFGLEKAKNITVFSLGFEGDCSDFNFTIGDLKRLVESHELVYNLGGLEEAKNYLSLSNVGIYGLKQAIADMESCL